MRDPAALEAFLAERGLLEEFDEWAATGSALEKMRPSTWVGTDLDPWFCEFWSAYPRRTGKGQARRAWRAATIGANGPRANARRVIRAAQAFAADPNLPPTHFIPHPATWLNGERWADGPLPPREPETSADFGVDL